MNFYPDAVFPNQLMLRSGVSLLDAAVWLTGSESIEQAVLGSDERRRALNYGFYDALHDLQVAIAMGELEVITVVTEKFKRQVAEQNALKTIAAKSGAIDPKFSPIAHMYIVPSKLQAWHEKKNSIQTTGQSVSSTPHLQLQQNETANSPSLIQSDGNDLKGRERSSYDNVIGAMLAMLKNHRVGRDTNSAIIDEMIKEYPEKNGISKRNLEKKFAAAKRTFES